MFILSKQDVTKFHLLQITHPGMTEPSCSPTLTDHFDTSRIVRGAFSTLNYHCEEMPVAESLSPESNCHSCCSVLSQLVKDCNQLKNEVERLKKKS